MQILDKTKAQSFFQNQSFFSNFLTNRSWEPGWLIDFRKENWELSQTKLDNVIKDENWRFSPSNRFGLSKITDVNEDKKLLNLSELDKDLGIFQNLDRVILDSPSELNIIPKLDGPQLGASLQYFLTSSLANDGYFFKVNSRSIVPNFITANHHLPLENQISFKKNITILEPFSEATIVEFIDSGNPDHSGILSNSTNVILQEGSKLNRIVIQNSDVKSTAFTFENFSIAKNASLKNIYINIGAQQSRSETKGNLIGEGAEFDYFSLFLGNENQLFDQRTVQEHHTHNCRSNLLCKNALNDQSKSVFSGMISVKPDAFKTNAYQTNRNLLLSSNAEANSLPGLEIMANDVKCSHGATTSRIDEQETFYLLSRGIPRNSAEKLIALGFLEEIIEQVPDNELNEIIRDRIGTKFDSN